MLERSLGTAAAVALALTALAACGGGDDDGDDTHYSRELSVRCLRTIAKPGKPRDFIARSAKEGAVRMVVENHEVTVSFARTIDEAEKIAEKYEPFGGKVVRRGNAVMRYSGEVSGDREGAIEDCLKPAPAPS